MASEIPRLAVDSEIGKLRRVLVHRPGREIDWMPPSMMEHLLFDDILDGEQARREHELFSEVLRAGGVEVLEVQELLAIALGRPGCRDWLFTQLADEYGVPPAVLGDLEPLAEAELAAALITGLPAAARPRAHGSPLSPRAFFSLAPVPNYFFQRDPQIVIGSRVVISSMATEAREREPLLARVIFERHPDLAGATLFEVDDPAEGASRRAREYPYPTLEGGDVVIASPEILLVGLSERTNRHGVEELAEYLRREETTFRHLIAVDLPPRRSFMHLDTVFTFIDRNTCLAYLPVIEPGSAESARVYYVDLTSPELAFRPRSSVVEALAELGLELELVPCGGRDLIDQQREQWTDGANAFALAPGVIVLYRRNHRTLEELARRGWRVLGEEEVVGGGTEVLGQGPTAISVLGNELSRARGGPRCMTMPLVRERD